MEDLKYLLRESESSDQEGSNTDSESSVQSLLNSLSGSTHKLGHRRLGRVRRDSSGSVESQAPQRKPTRRPDPNIQNRNALLARENRLRKKQHLETIENELEDVRNTNRRLLKALKKQMKACRRLEQEKSYFRNILANRTEILNLVSAINSQMQNKRLGLQSPSSTCSSEDSAVKLASCKTYQLNSETGTVATQQNTSGVLSQDANNYIDEFFTDLQPFSEAVTDSWNDLLRDEDFGLNNNVDSPSPHSSSEGNIERYNISEEHSYVTLGDNNDNIDIESLTNTDGGVCLHITGGKISLEFCPSCHWRASSTLPAQLLQTECP